MKHEKPTILIATTNPGKKTEIFTAFDTLPFNIKSLDELGQNIPEPEETGKTIEENALQKARFYAQITGLPALAVDAGVFLDCDPGWPGVSTKLIGVTDDERRHALIDRIKLFGGSNTRATFRVALALCDPNTKESFISMGDMSGEILMQPSGTSRPGNGLDSIFYLPELKKTCAELSPIEKNAVSHRGKALTKLKYILHNQWKPKHVVVPVGIIIKNGKILMNLRNDPHNPEVHKTWEFPGGTVEFGETLEQNVIREIKEEVGYDVKIISMLRHITVSSQMKPNSIAYQVYLIPFVCTIAGGDGKVSDSEVLDTDWFDLDDVLNQKLILDNDTMYEAFLPELKEIISKHNL